MKCGGDLIFETELSGPMPIMYHHVCNKCGHYKNLYDKNPKSVSE